MNKKIIKSFELFLLLSCLISCATTPKVNGKGDLCGLIIDENNQPIGEMVVHLVRNGIVLCSGITSETGMFVFTNIAPGRYCISGEKEGFSKIEEEPVAFYDRRKLFVCKTDSGVCVLEKVGAILVAGALGRDAISKTSEDKDGRRACFDKKYFKTVENLLDSIVYANNKELECAVRCYKCIVYKKSGNKEALEKELKTLEELSVLNDIKNQEVTKEVIVLLKS